MASPQLNAGFAEKAQKKRISSRQSLMGVIGPIVCVFCFSIITVLFVSSTCCLILVRLVHQTACYWMQDSAQGKAQIQAGCRSKTVRLPILRPLACSNICSKLPFRTVCVHLSLQMSAQSSIQTISSSICSTIS